MKEFFIALVGLCGFSAGMYIPKLSSVIINKKLKAKGIESNTTSSFFSRKTFRIIISIVNAIVWSLVFIYSKNALTSIFINIFFSLAIIFSIIDIQIYIIPRELVYITILLGSIFQITTFGFKEFLLSLLCMVSMIALFTLLALIAGLDKVGAGDVKLAGVMGIVLGYPYLITGVFAMSLVMIAGVMLGLKLKLITLKSMLPFAPFMMIGLIVGLSQIIFI